MKKDVVSYEIPQDKNNSTLPITVNFISYICPPINLMWHSKKFMVQEKNFLKMNMYIFRGSNLPFYLPSPLIVSTLTGKNLFLQEQIFPFKSKPHFERSCFFHRYKQAVTKVVALCLKQQKNMATYPFTLIQTSIMNSPW